MKSISVLLCTLCLLGGSGRSVMAAEKTNVLVIIADDQGYGDFGFMGNRGVHTPNIDRLAEESALFKNFVVAPACSPTRSSFLTGRNHLSVGVWGVGNRGATLRDETIMPQFFQSGGYGTCYFGKRDSIAVLERQPWDRGCNDAFVGVGGYVHRDPTIVHKAGTDDMKGWTCDINVDQALAWIRSQEEKPWWATVAFIVPHLPWICDEKYSSVYRKEGCTPALSNFYGCVSQLDDAVGRLLAGLRDSGRERDTIVVFFSDNGPSYKEMTDEEAANRNVGKLRGNKATAWDNGIRQPLLIRWPGKIPPGERRQFASVEDILPTLIDLSRLSAKTLPAHLPFDGISFRAALENPAAPDPERTVFRIAIAGDGAPRDHEHTGVIADPRELRLADHHVTLRGNRFKYHFLPGGGTALYNIVSDPGETTDISSQYPEIAAGMAEKCRAQWNAFLNSGRAFKMPAIIVTSPSEPGTNKLDTTMARRVTGQARVSSEGVRGFSATGDSAEFAIEIREPGKFKITVNGDGDLANHGEWSLTIAGTKLTSRDKSPGTLEFGPVHLPAGPAGVVLAIEGSPKKESTPVLIKKIGFYPIPSPSTTKPTT